MCGFLRPLFLWAIFILFFHTFSRADEAQEHVQEFRQIVIDFLRGNAKYSDPSAFLDMLLQESDLDNAFKASGPLPPDLQMALDAFNNQADEIVQEALENHQKLQKEGHADFAIREESVQAILLNALKAYTSQNSSLYTYQQATNQAASDLNQRPGLNALDSGDHDRQEFLQSRANRYLNHENPLNRGEGVNKDAFVNFLQNLEEELLDQQMKLTIKLFDLAIEQYNPGELQFTYDRDKPFFKDLSELLDKNQGKIIFQNNYQILISDRAYSICVGKNNQTKIIGTPVEINLLAKNYFINLLKKTKNKKYLIDFITYSLQQNVLYYLEKKIRNFKNSLYKSRTLSVHFLKSRIEMQDWIYDKKKEILRRDLLEFYFNDPGYDKLLPKIINGLEILEPGYWFDRTQVYSRQIPPFKKFQDWEIIKHSNNKTRYYRFSYDRYLKAEDNADFVSGTTEAFAFNDEQYLRVDHESRILGAIKNSTDPLGEKTLLFKVVSKSAIIDLNFILGTQENYPHLITLDPLSSESYDLTVESLLYELKGIFFFSNTVPIPTNKDFELTHIEIRLNNETLKQGVDFEVLYYPKRHLYFFRILNKKITFAKLHYKAYFKNREIPNAQNLIQKTSHLDQEKILPIIERLEQTKFKHLGNALRGKIEDLKKKQIAFGVNEIIQVFNALSLYSGRPASNYDHPFEFERLSDNYSLNMLNKFDFSDTHTLPNKNSYPPEVWAFVDFEKFIAEDNMIHMQCHAANVFLQRFLSQYFADDPDIQVGVMTTLPLHQSKYLVEPGHIITYVYNKKTGVILYFDNTPQNYTENLKKKLKEKIADESLGMQNEGMNSALSPSELKQKIKNDYEVAWTQLQASHRKFSEKVLRDNTKKNSSGVNPNLEENKKMPWQRLSEFFNLISDFMRDEKEEALRSYFNFLGMKNEENIFALISQRARDLDFSMNGYSRNLRSKTKLSPAELRYLDYEFNKSLNETLRLLINAHYQMACSAALQVNLVKED